MEAYGYHNIHVFRFTLLLDIRNSIRNVHCREVRWPQMLVLVLDVHYKLYIFILSLAH